jgi:hypothetical protein
MSMSVTEMDTEHRAGVPVAKRETNEPASCETESLSRRISSRVVFGLSAVRNSTERAVLKIGELLNNIVRAATSDDAEVRKTLQCVIGGDHQTQPKSGKPIVESLRNQGAAVATFVDETRRFFDDQREFTRAASNACANIHSSASLVTDLMTRSQILALNMQIESARLGQQGRAVNVIAQEMKHFASEVRIANESIKVALSALLSTLPTIEHRTSEMDGRMKLFADRIGGELQTVERQTTALAACMQSALDQTETRNAQIVQLSHSTLSELQFQDPAAQTLRRMEHEVGKLQMLISRGVCQDMSLAEIADDVGEDGSAERSTGEIELF